MKLPAMMCAASAGLGRLASLSAVAVRGPLVALQMAFALATYSAWVGAALTAVPAPLVVFLLAPPQPAAARTSAAPAASAVGLERTVTARRRRTDGWLSSSRWVLTLMGILMLGGSHVAKARRDVRGFRPCRASTSMK